MSAKHNNLYEAFVSEAEIPIADIRFDLTPMVEYGFSVGELARGWMVLLYTVLILLNCSMLLYLYCCTVAVLLYMVGSSVVDWYADTGTASHMTDSLV